MGNTNEERIMKTKIQIKGCSGNIIFEYEKEDNTIKDTLTEAVRQKISLYRANLLGANLREADLGGADLCEADLRGAKEIPFVPFTCPSDGAFIGWKKVYDEEYEKDYLIKLEICDDSKRSSATGTKCRCDKAKVLEITEVETGEHKDKVVNTNYTVTTYSVGEMVYADEWNENRWEECSHGIHFFINRQEALNYEV